MPKNSSKKKVALVGSASSSRNQAPWGHEDFEVWYLAWRADAAEMPDRFFDMHDLNRASSKIPPEYHQHLINLKRPVYSTHLHPNIPNVVPFPLSEVVNYLSSIDPTNWDGKYFASSIAYMLALAIYEEFEEIHLYGIDLLTDDEYAYQRPNAEYLIGLARGLGRKVYIPSSSALIKFNHVYGYEDPPSIGYITPQILEDRKRQYQEKHNKSLAEAYTADGARQETESLLQMMRHQSRGGHVSVAADRDKIHKQLAEEAKQAQGSNGMAEPANPASKREKENQNANK